MTHMQWRSALIPLRVGGREQLYEGVGRCGARFVLQERDLDGREIALEHAQLIDAAADGRLLAKARADRKP